MATVTSMTVEHLEELADEQIISGEVVGDNLILEQRGGVLIDAGNVRGADGDAGTGTNGLNASEIVPFSVGGVLAVQAFTFRLYVNRNCTISSVRASVGTAPTGAAVVVDVLRGPVAGGPASTLFTGGTDRPSIASGTNTDVGVPAVTSLLAGDYLTVTIVQVGSTYAGADLTVQVVAT